MHDHAVSRDRYLHRAIDMLSRDDRLLAAWLAGSCGRGEQDEWSDLDLWIVIHEDAAATLCATPGSSGGGTADERLQIFSGIGEPAIIHEHHANAPAGGSFTSCVYADGVMVDWTLVPQRIARRSPDTSLLFDRIGIPVETPAPAMTAEERAARLSERCAFAWMMVVPTSKAVRRADGVEFHANLELMHGALAAIEALLAGETLRYRHRSRAPFAATRAEQLVALGEVVTRLEALEPAVRAAGGEAPASGPKAIERWMGAE